MAGPTKLRRDAGVIGLLYASLGSIIGSGWLFGPLHAAIAAGPYSVYSWIIGAAIILLLAFTFAELSTMFPNSGALVHMVHVSHGDLLGKIWSWILFLAFVSVPPVEVMAVLTYSNGYAMRFMPALIHTDTGLLTNTGFVAAAIMLAFVVTLNFLAVRWVIAINSAATWWKLLIPLATIAVLFAYSFHPENMSAHLESAPTSGAFTAVGTAGIIFSYLGFQQAIALAGETRNPGRYVPIALIGSVIIGLLVYVGLQVSFITALLPQDIAQGWPRLHFANMFGPLAAIAIAVGAFWWAVLLYIDAIISPLGTAFIYITACPRIVMAAGEMGNAPRKVIELNRYGVPWVGLVVSYLVGVVFFFPFPSWPRLVSAVADITVLSYAIGPVLLLRLRKTMPDAPRPFKLRAPLAVSAAAFVASSWIIYWTGYSTVWKMLALVAAYLVVYQTWYVLRGKPLAKMGWQNAWWLIPYFGGLLLVSLFGPQDMGGRGAIGFFPGMGILAAYSLLMLWLACVSGQDAATAQATSDHVGGLGSRGVESGALEDGVAAP